MRSRVQAAQRSRGARCRWTKASRGALQTSSGSRRPTRRASTGPGSTTASASPLVRGHCFSNTMILLVPDHKCGTAACYVCCPPSIRSPFAGCRAKAHWWLQQPLANRRKQAGLASLPAAPSMHESTALKSSTLTVRPVLRSGPHAGAGAHVPSIRFHAEHAAQHVHVEPHGHDEQLLVSRQGVR